MTDCIFCSPPQSKVLLRNELAYALWDGFPVTPLHCMIIPRRHIADYFSLSRDEVLACDELLRQTRARLLADDPTIQGFNIGLNAGAVAGQTIFHCHFHLIPRRAGDVAEPRGGIRNVIPGKGSY